jgi:serine/threonine protein kinase
VDTLNLGIDGLDEVEQIGRGGSSRVYKARQVELDRLVALKVLKAGDDPHVVRRFDRERRAMGRLSLHDGIVPVYSSGLTDHDEPYLIMPYYENGSLQDRINQGPVPWQEAVAYVMDAANTMKAAHEAGVVHLDLKPANILLTGDDSPRIADFGIAKLVNDPNSSAHTTGAAFTPTFSAPEVLLTGSAAPTADVYGLAATLWSLIAGRPPFRADTAEDNTLMAVVGRVVHQPIDDIRHLAPDAVCNVIERGMAKDPAHRYPTAGAFAEALAAANATASSDRHGQGPIRAGWEAPGSFRFHDTMPPRLVAPAELIAPIEEDVRDSLARYSVLGVIAAAAVATIVIVLGLRSLGTGDEATPSSTSEPLVTRATISRAGLSGASSSSVLGGVGSDRIGDEGDEKEEEEEEEEEDEGDSLVTTTSTTRVVSTTTTTFRPPPTSATTTSIPASSSSTAGTSSSSTSSSTTSSSTTSTTDTTTSSTTNQSSTSTTGATTST